MTYYPKKKKNDEGGELFFRKNSIVGYYQTRINLLVKLFKTVDIYKYSGIGVSSITSTSNGDFKENTGKQSGGTGGGEVDDWTVITNQT